ncbi:MAG TPA: cyclic nucleotide-binding domain-containing protein [Terriglobia bacterium]|jgi:CRP-like cAMP-binding protein|nr:cyclic nucleotide-binding domain-containing protein [Terriglobia bacterium]
MVTATQTTRFLPFLDLAEETALLASAPVKSFDRGQLVLDQNVLLRAIFLIEEGSVRVERRDQDQTVPLAVLESGEFFGEMSYVDGSPTSARVIADMPTRLRVIDEATVNDLITRDPAFAGRLYHSIAAILAERLRLTSMHLDCLIEGIDFYSQTRAEIEAAAAKLPGSDWRTGLVATVLERERKS